MQRNHRDNLWYWRMGDGTTMVKTCICGYGLETGTGYTGMGMVSTKFTCGCTCVMPYGPWPCRPPSTPPVVVVVMSCGLIGMSKGLVVPVFPVVFLSSFHPPATP